MGKGLVMGDFRANRRPTALEAVPGGYQTGLRPASGGGRRFAAASVNHAAVITPAVVEEVPALLERLRWSAEQAMAFEAVS